MMRTLLNLLFFAGLISVPAGFLLLPLRIGLPVALIGGVVLQVSHYQLSRMKKSREQPLDEEVLDEGMFVRPGRMKKN